MTHTRTVATLHVSNDVFKEIETRLRDAGYNHVFFQNPNGELNIDMTGIALQKNKKENA